MTAVLIALLVLSAITMCTPRGAQSRAEIRAAARTVGWLAIIPAARHLAAQALFLLVELLRVAAMVAAIAAGSLESAGRTS